MNVIPYNINLYKTKLSNNVTNNIDYEFLASIVGEIYLAIVEEKVEEDFILRFNGIINKYYNKIININILQIVSSYCYTNEILETSYMIRNREYAIKTLEHLTTQNYDF